MNDAFTPRHLDLHTRPQRLEQPEPDRADAAETERRNALATHRDPSVATDADEPEKEEPGRARVQWVRPTDLAARGGAVVLERGAEWNRQLHDTVMDAVRDGRARLGQRLERRQDDLADTAPAPTGRPAAGRTTVSR